MAIITVKAGPWKEEYKVYLKKGKIVLQFGSTDADRVYQKAHVLRLLGVEVEPRKEGSRNVWYIEASTDVLACKAVSQKFRETLARAVEEAAQRGLVDANRAAKWAEKLRTGITLAEDKPKFTIQIVGDSLSVMYYTTSVRNLTQYVDQLKGLGLEEGIDFRVKWPSGGEPGYLRISVEGVKRLADLWRHAEDKKIRLKAEEWVKYLLARAEESGGNEAREKLERLIEEGEARGAFTLIGVHEVEIDGERQIVEIRNVKAWVDEKNKLHIDVEAVVDGVEVRREFMFFRVNGKVKGYVSTLADVPDGRKADIKRLKAISKVVFGKTGNLKSNGKQLQYTEGYLEYAMSYREIKEEVKRWLRGTNKYKHDAQRHHSGDV